MPSLDVVTVGSAVIDHVYTLSNLPEPDGGAFVQSYTTAAGGVAANVASALAELEHETGIVTRLGAEAAGIEADLRERNLDVARVRSGPEESSYSLVLRGLDGERMVLAGGRSVANLRLADADMPYLRDASVVFTSAYAPDSVVSRLVAARERGEISMLVFDLAGPLPEFENRGTRPATIDRLLAVVDLFVVSEVAARSYFDGGADETAAVLAGGDIDRAAVTRGREGALLVDGDSVIEIPTFDVAIEDTTGAGDVFTAGLIHAWLLEGSPAPAAGRFAAAGAALNCTALGARGRLPTKQAVRALLE
ncbi:carbohydrate kinase family protein [Halobacteriales archaeon QS_3_64_16]|nr:MAG: carbohydrate kinase family protein [Halobacteriales archaeon QS_3_64_16]